MLFHNYAVWLYINFIIYIEIINRLHLPFVNTKLRIEIRLDGDDWF